MTQDYAEALRWWRSAAEQGLLDATLALGNIYAGGTGIAKDSVLTYMWFHIATQQTGNDWLRGIAGSNRDAIAGRMTPDDLSKAKVLAAEWSASTKKSIAITHFIAPLAFGGVDMTWGIIIEISHRKQSSATEGEVSGHTSTGGLCREIAPQVLPLGPYQNCIFCPYL